MLNDTETSENSTGLFGADELISCAAASPAKTSASRGRALASTENAADYGSTCSGLFEKPDLVGSSLRTSIISIIRELTPFSAVWKKRVTPAGRSWWVLTTWERPTEESGSGSSDDWRTPQSRDFHPAQDPEVTIARGGRTDGQVYLAHQVSRHWQTPATDSFRSRGGDRKDEMGLDQQARAWTTPCSDDTGTRKKRYAQGGTALSLQAQWPTPTGVTETGGLAACKWGGAGSREMMRKTEPVMMNQQLSADWVEQLMGYPQGWTSLDGLPDQDANSSVGKRAGP